MANFDSNIWYQLFVNQNNDSGLVGTALFNDNRRGAVFFQPFNKTHRTQRWQLYGINSTTYVLRCQEGGANAVLGTYYNRSETTPGQTRALMVNHTEADESVYWSVSPWGDGTFFLTNAANGTAWHLQRKASDGLLAMSSNITAPQNLQRWSLKAIQGIKKINNGNFSTVDLPFTTATTAAPPSGTGSTSPPDTGSSGSSGGLSTGAKAAIGGVIGGIAVIALVVGLLWFLRRRKRSAPYSQQIELSATSVPAELAPSTVKYEMYQDSAAKHEMPVLKYEQPPVELPDNTTKPDAR